MYVRMYSWMLKRRGIEIVGGGRKSPQSLLSGGGWKMTKTVAEKAMVSCHKFVSKYYCQVQANSRQGPLLFKLTFFISLVFYSVN